VSRLTKHLVWTAVTEPAPENARTQFALTATLRAASTKPGVAAPVSNLEALDLDIALPAREQAVYLLHVGAEVEHALMVQYLYAAYSLGGPNLTVEQQTLVRQWRDIIVQIAREEMGHWAAVENLLTLLGAPLNFAREDFPIPKDLYPFAFELEPLTKRSLGKYVLAEMPTEDVIKKLGLEKKIEEIRKYVGGDAAHDKSTVHRVGIIYSAINELFQSPVSPQEPPKVPPAFIRSEDILADSKRFQVRPEEWGLGYKDMLIGMAVDRSTASDVVTAISVQGEGSDIKDLQTSHFGRFLDIYERFPDEHGWQPARHVARNPTTDDDAPSDRRITYPLALRWAELFNVRYRMLLMFLVHSFHIEAPAEASQRTPRGLLISWAFGEMYNLRSIANILMDLPLHEHGDKLLAGPPFEMPYSLALAPREPGRWRQHRDMLQASQMCIRELEKMDGSHAGYLRGLLTADQEALDQITTLMGGL
jgi:Ferritin-like